jgi:Tol biopolymer transport system component
MTTNERFERTMSAWLHDDSAFRVPDHLDEVLATTRATRQRPWWSSPERWLPVDTTFRPRLFTVPSPARLIAVAALILLILAIAVFAVGSQQRLPAPFGLARNGDFVTSRDGEIYRIDPTTAATEAIVSGEGFDFSPIFSRDGTKFVFLRSSERPSTTPGSVAVLTLYVAKADGTGARALTPPTESLDWFDWSPDGARVAYVAKGILHVVDVAGGPPVRLLDAGRVFFPTWLPPDGKEIVFRVETSYPGIYAIAPDGTGKRRPVSTTPPNNEYDYQAIAVSPDGSHLTFTRWFSQGPDGKPYPSSLGWLPRVYAMDVASGTEVALPTAPGTGQRGTAVYSPGGDLVAYARIYREGAFQIVVADADGSGNERPMGEKRPGPTDGSEVDAAWTFTPDGSALLVRYGDDDEGTTHLMPLDGSPSTDLGSGGYDFVDVQRLAP